MIGHYGQMFCADCLKKLHTYWRVQDFDPYFYGDPATCEGPGCTNVPYFILALHGQSLDRQNIEDLDD